MQTLDTPFNLGLLHLTPEALKGVKQVTALDNFEGSSDNFHPKGLFSTEIFGRMGDERRSLMFGYIDLRIPIMHPLVFMTLLSLKRLYGDIISGKMLAVWDQNKKDFVKAKISEGGRTGYAFFMEHFHDIDYGTTTSTTRQEYIDIVTKHRDKIMTRYVVVMPAGLREMEIDELGRRKEDEINKVYRSLIYASNVIIESSVETNPQVYDKTRYDMQMKFCMIYDHIESLLRGKKKLFLGKVSSRRVFNGTRNVITAMNTAVPVLGKKGSPGANSTIVGLYQYLRATLPVTCAQVRDFLSPMFPDSDRAANLVDRKTLKPREVLLHARYFDRWGTTEGIDKLIASMREETIRDKPIVIDGYYLGLLYLGPDNTFKVFQDIDELPEGRLREHVRPLTLTDVFYLSVYKHSVRYPGFVTRYPITSVGSIYPSRVHLRVTADFTERRPLSEDWGPGSDEDIAYEFPVQGSAFVNSLSPHTSHIKRLGADYDGDTSSLTIGYSDEAILEADRFFLMRKAYIGTDGKLLYSTSVDTVDLVMHNLTGDPAIA